MYIKEACVEGVEQALFAERNGADRIELCADLDVGGITPSLKTIKEVYEKVKIPIRVMIRPRGGNFVYSVAEFEMMKTQIMYCHKIGVEGVVFGILKQDNTLDLEKIKTLVNAAIPMKVVIHKAIDETPNILEAVQELLKIQGITTVLTSGGEITAEEGKQVLKKMVSMAKDKLEILPGGSITNENIYELHQVVKATAYHGKKIVGNITV